MPVTKSTLQADYANNGNPADGIKAAGRIRFLNDTVVFEGDESSADIVALLPNLPAGALVDPAKSSIVGPAQSGVTVDLGTTDASNSYANSVSIGSAGTRYFDTDGFDLIEVAAGSDLVLTVDTGSPVAGSQRVSIAYYVR
jgi:hypothetical protein